MEIDVLRLGVQSRPVLLHDVFVCLRAENTCELDAVAHITCKATDKKALERTTWLIDYPELKSCQQNFIHLGINVWNVVCSILRFDFARDTADGVLSPTTRNSCSASLRLCCSAIPQTVNVYCHLCIRFRLSDTVVPSATDYIWRVLVMILSQCRINHISLHPSFGNFNP